jgi:hypothetical protein
MPKDKDASSVKRATTKKSNNYNVAVQKVDMSKKNEKIAEAASESWLTGNTALGASAAQG